jgi:hypothetical protein
LKQLLLGAVEVLELVHEKILQGVDLHIPLS